MMPLSLDSIEFAFVFGPLVSLLYLLHHAHGTPASEFLVIYTVLSVIVV